MSGAGRHVFGVDIGGTFTDVVLLCPDGQLLTRKVASTTSDYTGPILLCLDELLAESGTRPEQVGGIVHGTTIATNTILEGRGARTALITTRGFRDVLEMRRLRIPVLYDLQYTPPRPLAPRRLRFEVRGRIGPGGEVWEELNVAEVEALADRIAALQVEAVAIALINAYANPAHERQVAEIVAARLPGRPHMTLSSDILPEIREYERTSTAVVNAYIGPIVERYLSALDCRLAAARLAAPLRIMQSNGGVIAAQAAAAKPAHIIESGPAAGVIASAALARLLGVPNAISLDMGGTTAKAALIEGGEPAKTSEYEVGAGINISSKLVKGGGHAVKLPFIDVSEIGAGGGSLVTVDALGALKVGPRSAGSNPGPCCYGLGGTEPTFTDAMVVLGYNSPEQLAGGRLRLRPELAHQVIAERVAVPLRISSVDAAWGVYAVAAANMMRAVKAVSTYRGRDPRDFTLFAFGGNGPLAAPAVARALGIRRIIVPPIPGLFSAFGLLCSHTEYVASQTLFRRISALDADEMMRALDALETQVRANLHADRVGENAVQIHRRAELRYAGQAFELPVPIGPGRPDPAELAAAFDAEHQRTYGHSSPGAPTDLVSVQVLGRALTGADAGALQGLGRQPAQAGSRRAYFGPDFGVRNTPVLSRRALDHTPRPGPLILEEDDATTVVTPDATCRLDPHGNIDIVLGD
ncbi:MAG: hydantoinase/oxoprolinase family protein [Acetobacteraceae bacterium]|nr:hydantoinase/oxoprolinase family protein [Acetobacteraceae bacterium]